MNGNNKPITHIKDCVDRCLLEYVKKGDHFDYDSSWCKINWIWDEIDKGHAKLIKNKNGIIHHIGKHHF